MHVDLLTLYFLAIGTLFASAGMTLWEHRSHPGRGKALRILAAAYATLAIGCALVLVRHALTGVLGSALANLVMVSGYLLILGGVAALNGTRYRAIPAAMLAALALTWIVAGTRWPDAMWFYLSAIPIALTSAMTARELSRSDALKSLQARRIAMAVTGIHALLYLGRALLLPWLARHDGPPVVLLASQITMYEGVLYSVILPMTLLKLVREETHDALVRESLTDYLTRLGNRRWFFEEGARLVAGGQGRQAFAVLAFDLDHFKRINDRYGHKTGDDVLRAFADIARGAMAGGTVLARIGGEEFAALLTGAEARRARELGESVACRFAETVAGRIDAAGIEATVSIGLAVYDSDAPALVDMLAAADRALYLAKALGGNRLELA